MRTALFDSSWGPIAVAICVGCLTLLAVLVALARPRGAWLRSRLDPYGRLESAGSAAASVDSSPGWRPRADRLYGATEARLESTRIWQSAMRLLERAGSQMRPAEFLYASVLVCLGTLFLVTLLTDSFGFGLLAGAGGLVAPWLWMRRRGARRLRKFEEQLPDILLAISSSLKVGLSFTHSLGAVVDDGQAPASEEFERLLNETELGRPMEDSLAAMADRVPAEDLRFVLMSVAIQREVGGSLAELFATVSETVRERQHFRRKVHALTSMGRMSAWILVALPFIMALLVSALSPSYIAPLFDTTAGHILIALMIVMTAIGAVFLKKIVTIKG